MAGYTYFAFRTQSFTANTTCGQRAAVHFLLWFYASPAAAALATQCGFVILPNLISSSVAASAASSILCRVAPDAPLTPAAPLPAPLTIGVLHSALAVNVVQLLAKVPGDGRGYVAAAAGQCRLGSWRHRDARRVSALARCAPLQAHSSAQAAPAL
jgi:hypothetical protein